MADWVTEIITSLGYWGIGLLMFLENLFPPIPSELIMPLAGFAIAQGEMSFVPVVLAGVIGTILGAIMWYAAGYWLGGERIRRLADRYGRWFGFSAEDVNRAQGWFNRHGNQTVFICRLVPGVRTLISVPAGTTEMAIAPFLIYSTLGTVLWTVFLTGAGYLLGDNYKLVGEWLSPISEFIVIGLVVLLVAWLGYRWQKTRRRAD